MLLMQSLANLAATKATDGCGTRHVVINAPDSFRALHSTPEGPKCPNNQCISRHFTTLPLYPFVCHDPMHHHKRSYPSQVTRTPCFNSPASIDWSSGGQTWKACSWAGPLGRAFWGDLRETSRREFGTFRRCFESSGWWKYQETIHEYSALS